MECRNFSFYRLRKLPNGKYTDNGMSMPSGILFWNISGDYEGQVQLNRDEDCPVTVFIKPKENESIFFRLSLEEMNNAINVT